MRKVQVAEVEGHVAELLAEVEQGETIEITRHGRTIARLVPDDSPVRRDVAEVKERITAFRRTAPRLTIDEIMSGRHDGHKY